MARPRQFDEQEVLERALGVFWEQGYTATSITDLIERTGLAKGSLYKAFGDKRQLFLRVLKGYLADGRSHLARRLQEAPSGRAGLEDWLRRVGAMARRGEPRRGCLGVNTTVELAAHDPDIRQVLERHAERTEALYAEAIRRGQAEGSLRPDLDPREGARFVAVVVHGLQALGRCSLAEEEVEPTVKATLRALELGPPK